ncbi:MAG: DegT/DnrJ/EryC1/StrS aminotransferase family protein [Chlorobi bacterium]|nr:DegT/DnrJ/EryC1/StrS aminotransferase family protein [Chlorobiota bacterium]
MQLIIENRASAILFNTVISNKLNKGKIMLPANICPIVPAVLFKAKAKFEFYDIKLTNYLPDENELYKIINSSENISAVLYNHTYGVEKNVETIFENIKEINKNIFIINDCCLKKPITEISVTEADITLYSTGYSKYTDLGFGGFAFLKKNVKYENSELKYSEKDHKNLVNGFNEVLKAKMKYEYTDTEWLNAEKTTLKKEKYFNDIKNELKNAEIHKTILNNIYKDNIKKEFHLGDEYNNWRFNISVNNKAYVLKKIFENGLFASSHYSSLVGTFGKGNGKNAELLHSKVINLFNDFRFNEEKAGLVSEIINKYAE